MIAAGGAAEAPVRSHALLRTGVPADETAGKATEEDTKGSSNSRRAMHISDESPHEDGEPDEEDEKAIKHARTTAVEVCPLHKKAILFVQRGFEAVGEEVEEVEEGDLREEEASPEKEGPAIRNAAKVFHASFVLGAQ